MSFLQFDFSKPINQFSFGLFLFFTIQFGYRIFIAIEGLSYLEKQMQGQKIVLSQHIKEVDIKKVIISDAMITFLFGILVFFPFWI
ncbi:MAG: hypothetical protein ACJATI_001109 [Halioglobus sp.]